MRFFSRAVAATSSTFHQAGVIAYRIQDGKVRVLLMTSRDTGRWIIPRGNIKPGVTPRRAAPVMRNPATGCSPAMSNRHTRGRPEDQTITLADPESAEYRRGKAHEI